MPPTPGSSGYSVQEASPKRVPTYRSNPGTSKRNEISPVKKKQVFSITEVPTTSSVTESVSIYPKKISPSRPAVFLPRDSLSIKSESESDPPLINSSKVKGKGRVLDSGRSQKRRRASYEDEDYREQGSSSEDMPGLTGEDLEEYVSVSWLSLLYSFSVCSYLGTARALVPSKTSN
jgi:hypothetical protein